LFAITSLQDSYNGGLSHLESFTLPTLSTVLCLKLKLKHYVLGRGSVPVLMQQEAKYIVRPDRAKGLRIAFHIRSNHAVVSLTLLPEDRDCLCPGRSVV